MNINLFQGQVTRAFGFSRPSRFRVTIALQKLLAYPVMKQYFDDLGIGNLNMASRLSLFCDTAQIPGISHVTTTSRFYGPSYQVPYMSIYPDITATFYVGTDMKERRFFEAWMNCMEDPITHDYNYYDEYTTDLTIEQFSDIAILPTSIPGLPQFTQAVQAAETGIRYASNIVPFLPNGIQNVFGGIANLDDLPPTHSVTLYSAFPAQMSPMSLGYEYTNQIHRLQIQFSYRKWKNTKLDRIVPNVASTAKVISDAVGGNIDFNNFSSLKVL